VLAYRTALPMVVAVALTVVGQAVLQQRSLAAAVTA